MEPKNFTTFELVLKCASIFSWIYLEDPKKSSDSLNQNSLRNRHQNLNNFSRDRHSRRCARSYHDSFLCFFFASMNLRENAINWLNGHFRFWYGMNFASYRLLYIILPNDITLSWSTNFPHFGIIKNWLSWKVAKISKALANSKTWFLVSQSTWAQNPSRQFTFLNYNQFIL